MVAFFLRTKGYQCGVVLLFISTGLYITGFGAPYWAYIQSINSNGTHAIGNPVTLKYHEGMWMLCVSAVAGTAQSTGCSNYGFSGFPAWFHTARILMVIANFGLLMACIYVIPTSCCKSYPGRRSRFLELSSGLGATLGFSGCILYVAMRKDKEGDTTLSNGTSVPESLTVFFSNWTFDWAFFLATFGSGFALIAAVIVAVFNKDPELQEGGSIGMTTIVHPPSTAVRKPQPYVYHGAPKPGGGGGGRENDGHSAH